MEFTASHGGLIDTVIMIIWVRKYASFAEEREADREFRATMTPDAPVAAFERLRKEWALISGRPEKRRRKTARVLDGPEG